MEWLIIISIVLLVVVGLGGILLYLKLTTRILEYRIDISNIQSTEVARINSNEAKLIMHETKINEVIKQTNMVTDAAKDIYKHACTNSDIIEDMAVSVGLLQEKDRRKYRKDKDKKKVTPKKTRGKSFKLLK